MLHRKLSWTFNHICQRRIPFIWRSVFAIIGAIIFTPPKTIESILTDNQPNTTLTRYCLGGSKTISVADWNLTRYCATAATSQTTQPSLHCGMTPAGQIAAQSSECFWSGMVTGDSFIAASATSSDSTMTLTSGSWFDFQHGVSY